MLKDISETTVDLTQNNLKKLEDDTDFTLDSHREERINFHMRMLHYYLSEQ